MLYHPSYCSIRPYCREDLWVGKSFTLFLCVSCHHTAAQVDLWSFSHLLCFSFLNSFLNTFVLSLITSASAFTWEFLPISSFLLNKTLLDCPTPQKQRSTAALKSCFCSPALDTSLFMGNTCLISQLCAMQVDLTIIARATVKFLLGMQISMSVWCLFTYR